MAGDAPASLEPGELAVNDGGSAPVLYIGTASGKVFQLSGQWSEVGSQPAAASRLLDESGSIFTTESGSYLVIEE